MLVHNDLCRFFQIPNPGIIAQTFPQLAKTVIIAGGKFLHGGQCLKKPGIVSLHGLHTGLLEHDL